ncbi:cysteine proteinase [Flagelloscypha sp. PMI_526]|nr:cysteine proteinase [Flagelloscypha sp. PMI_526]
MPPEFNALLPPPVEFIEGSSTGSLALSPVQYTPINRDPPPVVKASQINGHTNVLSPQKPSRALDFSAEPKASQSVGHRDLYPHELDLSFPILNAPAPSGLYNKGNSCFFNSALQCLLHTGPLLRLILSHKTCSRKSDGKFCMTDSLRSLLNECFKDSRPCTPNYLYSNLNQIAKDLRKGRQEDSHEFLRYAIDAIQRATLQHEGLDPLKTPPKVANTTWINKIFGGQLRSRVHCQSCGHNSDTFDTTLDLSVDVHGCETLEAALRKFVAADYLKGDDKYKCEKCKKHVNAEKRFTVHQAPNALTIHLKRFTPWGKKITHPVSYPEKISLRPYMSQGAEGPTYSLYGLILHIGSGPHSGHYTAICKGRNGIWHEYDDDDVSKSPNFLSRRHAYMLFYIRDQGPSSTPSPSPKRPLEEDDRVVGPPAKKPFIGPQLPQGFDRPPLLKASSSDAGSFLKSKIDALQKKKANGIQPQSRPQSQALPQSKPKVSLVPDDYGSDSDSADSKQASPPENNMPPPSSSPQKSEPDVPQTPVPPKKYTGIPASTFYGSSSGVKRKFPGTHYSSSPRPPPSPSPSRLAVRNGLNPYGSIGNNLRANRGRRARPI